MSKAFQKLVLGCGLLSLAHAAYSAAQHRTYLRITEQEFTTLPLDIILQAVISLAIIIYSILSLKSDWKLIHATDLQEKSSWETLSNIQSFYTFNHRGKAIFNPHYLQPAPVSMDSLH
ncbi:CLUMA_CG013848, isoform A [Clunio marinus]|uniref:Membrane magnesium transporter n=1 Tax=Clunio marinus TaxID=568069 RepID=A0A1J1ILZ7_9DIPT|nr:CLUMA_CG013848, isoform A [Clunio marinus]